MSVKQIKWLQIIQLAAVALFLLAAAAVFIFLGEEIKYLFELLVQKFGLAGLFVATVVMDVLIQPVGPDVLTFGYSMTEQHVLTVSLVGGLGSLTGGTIGYGLGYFLEEKGIDKLIGKEKYQKAHSLFTRHGFWAVLIGALTPVPFSLICWTAGVFKMPFRLFFVSALVTRLPRFLLVGYLGALFV